MARPEKASRGSQFLPLEFGHRAAKQASCILRQADAGGVAKETEGVAAAEFPGLQRLVSIQSALSDHHPAGCGALPNGLRVVRELADRSDSGARMVGATTKRPAAEELARAHRLKGERLIRKGDDDVRPQGRPLVEPRSDWIRCG
jgi:hypothetical protein